MELKLNLLGVRLFRRSSGTTVHTGVAQQPGLPNDGMHRTKPSQQASRALLKCLRAPLRDDCCCVAFHSDLKMYLVERVGQRGRCIHPFVMVERGLAKQIVRRCTKKDH